MPANNKTFRFNMMSKLFIKKLLKMKTFVVWIGVPWLTWFVVAAMMPMGSVKKKAMKQANSTPHQGN